MYAYPNEIEQKNGYELWFFEETALEEMDLELLGGHLHSVYKAERKMHLCT